MTTTYVSCAECGREFKTEVRRYSTGFGSGDAPERTRCSPCRLYDGKPPPPPCCGGQWNPVDFATACDAALTCAECGAYFSVWTLREMELGQKVRRIVSESRSSNVQPGEFARLVLCAAAEVGIRSTLKAKTVESARERADEAFFAENPEMRGRIQRGPLAPKAARCACGAPCRERGNGSENRCERCACDQADKMHDALSDILEAPETVLLQEHRQGALEALGLAEHEPHDCGDWDCIKRRIPDAECDGEEDDDDQPHDGHCNRRRLNSAECNCSKADDSDPDRCRSCGKVVAGCAGECSGCFPARAEGTL